MTFSLPLVLNNWMDYYVPWCHFFHDSCDLGSFLQIFLVILEKFWSFLQLFFLFPPLTSLTGTTIICVIGCLKLLQNPLMLYSFFFLQYFSLYISFWIISLGLHSNSSIYIFCMFLLNMLHVLAPRPYGISYENFYYPYLLILSICVISELI